MDKAYKDSYAYKKYLRKYDKNAPENIEKRKRIKAKKRKDWWVSNWISVVSMIIAAMALVVSLVK